MNRRILISICVAGAFAFACGPRTGTDASPSVGTVFQRTHSSILPATRAAAAPARKGDKGVRVDSLGAKFVVMAQAHEVRFALEVKNAGTHVVEVNFPSGQNYDFTVVDSVGRQVWRWADGRMFTQSMQNRLLSRGEVLQISERWERPKAGSYTAIATLRSSNYPVVQRVQFSVAR